MLILNQMQYCLIQFKNKFPNVGNPFPSAPPRVPITPLAGTKPVEAQAQHLTPVPMQ